MIKFVLCQCLSIRLQNHYVTRVEGKEIPYDYALIILLCDLIDKVAAVIETGRKAMPGTNSCPARTVPPPNPSE